MKKSILMMLFPVVLLFVMLQFNALPNSDDERLTVKVEEASLLPEVSAEPEAKAATRVKINKSNRAVNTSKRDQIISYAYTLLGTPYVFGGMSKNGFDCSGFTTYVFEQNNVDLKRSSSLQATEGVEIDRSEAAPGDLIIFTGTDKTVREPGHVGIVISEPGDTIEFIHSSSSRKESGVKISQVEGSGYDDRFLSIRRIL